MGGLWCGAQGDFITCQILSLLRSKTTPSFQRKPCTITKENVLVHNYKRVLNDTLAILSHHCLYLPLKGSSYYKTSTVGDRSKGNRIAADEAWGWQQDFESAERAGAVGRFIRYKFRQTPSNALADPCSPPRLETFSSIYVFLHAPNSLDRGPRDK